MLLNSSALNTSTLNSPSGEDSTFSGTIGEGSPINIQAVILDSSTVLSARLVMVISEEYSLTANIQAQITHTQYSLTANIQAEIYEQAGISAPILAQIFGASDGSGVTPAGTAIPAGLMSPSDEPSFWTMDLFVDSVELSSSLVGNLSVDLEESSARVCTFTLTNPAGVVDLTSWVGADVVVVYVKTTSTGVRLSQHTIFKGFVDVPNFDTTTLLTTYQCTDGLQKTFENKTREEVDDAVGGFWSEEVFSNDADRWSYAQDRLSTIPYSLNYDVNNILVKTPWLGKVVEDLLLNASVILDQSLSVAVGNSRSIVNTVNLSATYQYESFKERKVSYVWRMNPSVESGRYFAYGFLPVTQQMVVASANADGWVFTETPKFEPWPANGFYHGVVSLNSDRDIVTGTNFVISKRYTQSVSQTSKIKLVSPKSVASIGPAIDSTELNVSAQYSDDANSFEDTQTKAGTFISRRQALLSSGSVTQLNQPFSYLGYAKEFANGVESSGEVIYDLDSFTSNGDRTSYASAVQVSSNLHKTNILKSHRGNSVSCRTLIEPNITTELTLKVDTPTIQAKGKVRQVTHTMNIQEGSAVSAIVIGLSRSTGVGIPDVETPLPTAPSQEDTLLEPVDSGLIVNNRMILGNYVQADPSSAQAGQNATGMQAYFTPKGTDFVVNFPGVSSSNLDALDIEDVQEVVVDVPDELLIITT